MKGTSGVLLLLALAATQAAAAADISASDTIVVTATRNELPLDDVIVPVHVITREDIELSMATDLAELLRFEAGIDIGRNGGPGQATSVFIRGTESNHVLVLVDGVRINPGTLGGAAFQHIAPEMIERVEVVKGARSALFGTDAIGGVINIITRRAADDYVEAVFGGGSFGSQSGSVSAGSKGEMGAFGLTLDWQQTDGFAPRTDSDIRRGYENLSANLYASRRFGKSEISARHWSADGDVEYLDFFLNPVEQSYANSATAVQFDSPIGERADTRLIVAHMRDEIRQKQSSDFVESSRTSVDWQATRSFDTHSLTGGVYVVDEDASTLSFGAGFDESTAVRAVFVQDQIKTGRHRAFAALRYTDHETFGTQTTWNAEYAFDVSSAWTLNAGLGRAFRAPDATDRFGFGGNPDLDPEIADSAQVRLQYQPGDRHRVDLEFYATDIDDLIEFDFATFSLVNIDRAEIRGTQLGYEYRGDAFSMRGELVRQDSDNKTLDARLLRRAEKSASITLSRDIGPHRIGVMLLASGDRVDFGGTELDGYVVVNVTGQIALSPEWQLNARIENLFDETYQTAADFRMQELSGFVELRYRRR